MNEKKRLKILVGVLCIVLVLLATLVAVILDSRSPDPILGIFQTDPTETTKSQTEDPMTPSEGQVTPPAPEDLPPSVVIPPEKDPETGKEIGISFPCEIPG